jgi:hypothetical protein
VRQRLAGVIAIVAINSIGTISAIGPIGAVGICAVTDAAGPPAQQIPLFRGGVDMVNLGVTVTDKKGNLLTDLTADDFEIYEDGKKQTVRFFSAGLTSGPGDPHTHLGLLLDVSESMGEDIAFTRQRRSNSSTACSKRWTSRSSISTPRCASRATSRASLRG